MPLRLEIKKKLSARSERVKCVDFHPTEPWILAGLYSGHVFIWNYTSQQMVKSIEVAELPVRTAKFLAAKNWIICGADDMQIRVYNYNTLERIKSFEAHTDYIRALVVHPTLPYILSSSDDMFLKLWDWDRGWECIQIFEGHTHYVMALEFNPKDPNTFASASLDRTVKVWGLNAPSPHFSLEGHERGVNCISYFRGGDRPYLASGADDHLIKVWDYQTKVCVATLEGHTNNISSVLFHPTLPIILSGSEDGTVRLWHANTYKLENTLNYGMERVWTISCLKGSNKVAIGYDDGTIMIKIGNDEPVVSMDKAGKIVWANNHEIMGGSVRSITAADNVQDGDRLPLQAKEMGACELYPQNITHSPNGRLLCACGDGEYIIYTALSLKNKSFGSALEFVWANDSGSYAVRESTSKVKIFKDFKEHKAFRPSFAAEGIFGGALLGVRSNDFVDLYDWDQGRIVRRIDVTPRKAFWSESGEVLVLACDSSMYVLRYQRELVNKWFEAGLEIPEQGIEGAFELEQEVPEKVRAGHFVGDCFVYTNAAGRLQYYVGGEVMTLAHLGKPMYLLGYLPKENRVYLMDKTHNIYSYSLLLSVLIYQTAIVRRDLEGAGKALQSIPQEHHNRLARFLEAQDLKELALEVATDPEHRFELAMGCKKLDLARSIALTSESEHKWRQIGDAALNLDFNLKLAEECYTRAKDLGGLLLLYTSMGDNEGMVKLAALAQECGRQNVAFIALLLLGRVEDCVKLLVDNDRIPEAAFMTRTYAPSNISSVLTLWKENLSKVSVTAASALADPNQFPDKFTNLQLAAQIEQWQKSQRSNLEPAIAYTTVKNDVFRNLIEELEQGTLKINSTKNNNPQPQPQSQPQSQPQPSISSLSPTSPSSNKSSNNSNTQSIPSSSPAPGLFSTSTSGLVSVPVSVISSAHSGVGSQSQASLSEAVPVTQTPVPAPAPAPAPTTSTSPLPAPAPAQVTAGSTPVVNPQSFTPTKVNVNANAATVTVPSQAIKPSPPAASTSSAFDELDFDEDDDISALPTSSGPATTLENIDAKLKSLEEFDDFE